MSFCIVQELFNPFCVVLITYITADLDPLSRIWTPLELFATEQNKQKRFYHEFVTKHWHIIQQQLFLRGRKNPYKGHSYPCKTSFNHTTIIQPTTCLVTNLKKICIQSPPHRGINLGESKSARTPEYT